MCMYIYIYIYIYITNAGCFKTRADRLASLRGAEAYKRGRIKKKNI